MTITYGPELAMLKYMGPSCLRLLLLEWNKQAQKGNCERIDRWIYIVAQATRHPTKNESNIIINIYIYIYRNVQVFIGKLFSIDGFTTTAIKIGKVAALNHKLQIEKQKETYRSA
jgi:hypothetical protein